MVDGDIYWKETEREPWGDVHSRIQRFFSLLVNRPETNIVIVTHGVWIESCLNMLRPETLGDRRVYNLDAYTCTCISHDGRFLRLDNVQKI